IPIELKLRTTETGPRLFSYPVKEVNSLRARSHQIKPQILGAAANPLAGIKGELLDIETAIAPADSSAIRFKIRGSTVTYNVKTQELSSGGNTAPLKMT